eukprot:CAMPEP_0194315850 /NCGR_PEP_ID=MMETSP0171-20130528/12630_1 /TAXON_ID=218684 /ORGANISM="Corethron pennatum, Strain L29A3" /LENGTH=250 /DNA_ID=CAMNT_0039071831 /DNA_START=28 /DNA_END=777 /DNA_ORIENTATION=+
MHARLTCRLGASRLIPAAVGFYTATEIEREGVTLQSRPDRLLSAASPSFRSESKRTDDPLLFFYRRQAALCEGSPGTAAIYSEDSDIVGPYELIKYLGLVDQPWVDGHAIHGSLRKDSLVERFLVYKNLTFTSPHSLLEGQHVEGAEIVLVDARLGNKLNGHVNIVHGGISSLLFDEAFGHAFFVVGNMRIGFTANLNVNFRSPLPANTDVVIRVYLDRIEKSRKIFLKARMESSDGSILYADATALFIT